MRVNQPEWENATEREWPEGFLLSSRQRDFLASYAADNVVTVIDQDAGDGAITVHANGNLDQGDRELVVPWEGFLTQPTVELHDHEVDISSLPEAKGRGK